MVVGFPTVCIPQFWGNQRFPRGTKWFPFHPSLDGVPLCPAGKGDLIHGERQGKPSPPKFPHGDSLEILFEGANDSNDNTFHDISLNYILCK